MDNTVSWFITVLIAIVLAAFLAYLWGLRKLKSGRRPRVPRYNRFGQLLGNHMNPKPETASQDIGGGGEKS